MEDDLKSSCAPKKNFYNSICVKLGLNVCDDIHKSYFKIQTLQTYIFKLDS